MKNGLTDLQILRVVLKVRSKLKPSEDKAFRGMLSDLERGMLINLSKKQRKWVEEAYYRLNLDRPESALPTSVMIKPLPPIRDQGSIGCSVAMATMGALDIATLQKLHPKPKPPDKKERW